MFLLVTLPPAALHAAPNPPCPPLPAPVAGDAVRAIAGAQRVESAILAGSNLGTPFQDAERFAALSRNTSDADLRELFERTARDQIFRAQFDVLMSGTSWAAGVSEATRQQVMPILMARGCQIDAANSIWLESFVRRRGWPRISTFGAEADLAAWLLVQHAASDPLFQSRSLMAMRPLLMTGETNRRNFAYLHDRVSLKVGIPQNFGTQGKCVARGKWRPDRLADPGGVARRRALYGLPPMPEYAAGLGALCQDATPPLLDDELPVQVRNRIRNMLRGPLRLPRLAR